MAELTAKSFVPMITSVPVTTGTVGQLYTYDVDARYKNAPLDAEGEGAALSAEWRGPAEEMDLSGSDSVRIVPPKKKDRDPGNADDLFTFSLDVAPPGMTVEAATGLIEWTPDDTDVGDHAVEVRVEDLGGLFDTQSYVLTVAGVNEAPVIVSSPVTTATETWTRSTRT
jgi:hypothetical protein